jgi:hypothetical protein
MVSHPSRQFSTQHIERPIRSHHHTIKLQYFGQSSLLIRGDTMENVGVNE